MAEKRKRFRIPWWGKVLIVLGTLPFLGIGLIYVATIVERGRWQRYAAEIRAAGEPVTVEDIEAMRTDIPDERNSALVLQKAIEQFRPFDNIPPHVIFLGEQGVDPDIFKGVPRYAIEETRKYIDEQRPFFEALQPILDMPTGRLDIPHTENPVDAMGGSNSGDFRRTNLAAYFGVIVALAEGDNEGGLRSLVLLFHLSGTMNEYPFLIGLLMRNQCDYRAFQAIEDCLHAAVFEEEALLKMRNAIENVRDPESMKRVIWGERALLVEAAEWLVASSAKESSSKRGLQDWSILVELICRRNQLRGAHLYADLLRVADDLDALQRATVRWDAQVDQLGSKYELVRILAPSLNRATQVQRVHDVRLECSVALIAAERFRLATARWPESLDELVPRYLPSVADDPFADGQPIKLVTTDQGIAIYSVGKDGVDDGGDVTHGGDGKRPPDTGYRLYDPEHRGVIITDEPRPEEGD